MGQLERQNKQKIRKTGIQHAVLATIAGTGLLAAGLLAPNAIGAMAKLGLIERPRTKDVVRSTASRLKSKGLLSFKDGHYSLTPAGQRILENWENGDYKIKKPKKWDQRWRVVTFDIPEKKRRKRDEVRRIFTQAGFRRLQDSVWIHPFDCEDMIELVKTDLGIGKDMVYMIVEQIGCERSLRQDFGLA